MSENLLGSAAQQETAYRALAAGANDDEVNPVDSDCLENLIGSVPGDNQWIVALKNGRQRAIPAGSLIANSGFLCFITRELSHPEGGQLFVGKLLD